MRTVLAVLSILVLSSHAFGDQVAKPAATTVEGAAAMGLVRALSLTPLKPAKDKTRKEWTVKLLACTTKDTKEPWELPITSCDADGKQITGAAAVMLEQAMNDAKIPAPYTMGMKQIRAAVLRCVQDERGKERGPFYCSYTPVGRG